LVGIVSVIASLSKIVKTSLKQASETLACMDIAGPFYYGFVPGMLAANSNVHTATNIITSHNTRSTKELSCG
jgi:hypothetical protein